MLYGTSWLYSFTRLFGEFILLLRRWISRGYFLFLWIAL